MNLINIDMQQPFILSDFRDRLADLGLYNGFISDARFAETPYTVTCRGFAREVIGDVFQPEMHDRRDWIKEHLRAGFRRGFNSDRNGRQDHAGDENELLFGGESELLSLLVHHIPQPLKHGP